MKCKLVIELLCVTALASLLTGCGGPMTQADMFDRAISRADDDEDEDEEPPPPTAPSPASPAAASPAAAS
ncbi:MAG TPA: hypothetical protein DDW52_19120, partial [Planctomycetaceae bacterium]|nr:hypothetical protein [Planctomycetaceae bacterium]